MKAVSTVLRSLIRVALLVSATSCGYKSQIFPLADPSVHGPRDLMVFFDGTSNAWDDRTNVRRLFEHAAFTGDPRRICYYSDGVGVDRRITGNLFGVGTRSRLRGAYRFLANVYREGDRIYIIGFSRGALSARTLSGVLSFCGLLEASDEDRAEIVFDYSDEVRDDVTDRTTFEKKRADCQAELLERYALKPRLVDIEFVGVWDTVPGLSGTEFDLCRETGDNGTRYKLRPYPPIKKMVHAVSIDEQRSKFAPVLLGEPIDAASTTIEEIWFPGVHADVGGGYADSTGLSGVPMNWMLDHLNAVLGAGRVHANPLGLQHNSYDCGGIAAKGSSRIRRCIPDKAMMHASFSARVAASSVPMQRKEGGDCHVIRNGKYSPRWALQTGQPACSPSSYSDNDELFSKRFEKGGVWDLGLLRTTYTLR